MRYDPLKSPDPNTWLEMDEGERIAAALDFHLDEFEEQGQAMVHAAIHAAVENQIAAGDETPARETLGRLMAEGLDRHEAVHAIGSVLAGQLWEAQNGVRDHDESNYFEELRNLTVAKWKAAYEDEA